MCQRAKETGTSQGSGLPFNCPTCADSNSPAKTWSQRRTNFLAVRTSLIRTPRFHPRLRWNSHLNQGMAQYPIAQHIAAL